MILDANSDLQKGMKNPKIVSMWVIITHYFSFLFLKFFKDNSQLFKALMIITYGGVYNRCKRDDKCQRDGKELNKNYI